MKSRPTIFLSGVSHELGSFRDAAENEIEMKGCFAENQPGFPPDYLTVEEMLRRKLHDSDAVIHLVGFRFGAEPNQRPEATPRRSYTQMEFDIAREMHKPVYVFLSDDPSIRDAAKPDEKTEDIEATALQLAHREAIQKTNYLYHFFKAKVDLCKLVAEIQEVKSAGFQADISRIDKYAPAHLIGREDEFKLLNDAWTKIRNAESARPHIVTFVALGGEGKTSLIAKWAAELAYHNWPECDAAFAWSFYSQGTQEQMAASSDLFLKEALTFFGDAEMAGSAHGAFDKGRRLAHLVGQHRALLILDGLEPLQYGPTSPTPGELKDAGLAAFLKGLAAINHGLCVVTTRYSVPDLKAFWQTTAPEVKLTRLSNEAGVVLLRSLGVKGTQQEFETLVEHVKGHALTLNLLGTFLHDAHAGDIRKRDLVNLKAADAEQGGHAFRVMDAYVHSFESEGEKGRCALAALRLLGLFDRPATADCLVALLKDPAIPGLTDALVGMSTAQRNLALTRLEAAKLLTVNRDAAGTLLSLDAHPLLREYFARQLRQQHSEGWCAAHRRIYEYLCAATPDKPQPGIDDLQPLYYAVAHGCHAGLQQEACEKVYFARIQRREEKYAVNKLGAFGSDLGAVACFFEEPWIRVSSALTETWQAWVLHQAGFRLRALGRLSEAINPIRAGLNIGLKEENWQTAARDASSLSELNLMLGEITKALGDADQAVTYAEACGEWYQRVKRLTTHADALHHAGRQTEAEARFCHAEALQAENQPECPLLHTVAGFAYCELLLATPERRAWQFIAVFQLAGSLGIPRGGSSGKMPPKLASRKTALLESCHAIAKRAAQSLQWATRNKLSLTTIALHLLTQSRAALYNAILEGSTLEQCESFLQHAVDGLHRAGTQHKIPHALLTRAWLRSLTGFRIGADSTQTDLDDAWEIAERGPMKLFMADIHLHRARLFFREKHYPWKSPLEDLAAARKLIESCGYWRRKEELEDAEAVINRPSP